MGVQRHVAATELPTEQLGRRVAGARRCQDRQPAGSE